MYHLSYAESLSLLLMQTYLPTYLHWQKAKEDLFEGGRGPVGGCRVREDRMGKGTNMNKVTWCVCAKMAYWNLFWMLTPKIQTPFQNNNKTNSFNFTTQISLFEYCHILPYLLLNNFKWLLFFPPSLLFLTLRISLRISGVWSHWVLVCERNAFRDYRQLPRPSPRATHHEAASHYLPEHFLNAQ